MAVERSRPFQQIHFLEAWNVPKVLFTNQEVYHATSLELVRALGLSPFGKSQVQPYPELGFSFQTFLTESAFEGHTWEELDYLNYLLHTCSVTDFSKAPDIAKNILQTNDVEFSEITPHSVRMMRRPSGLAIPG